MENEARRIPRQLRRDVEVEAGNRCAIPTCRSVPIEIAHIDPWSKVKEHRFDNLIALCPTCHTRFDNNDIDRQAMLQYKANLSVIAGRYGDLEQRVLRLFSENPEANATHIAGGMELLVRYLVDDGLLAPTGEISPAIVAGVPAWRIYELTPKGREFITHWLAADPLE